MCDNGCRHELFETARKRGEWTITDLWVHYLALGGGLDLFTIEAFLHGLVPLAPMQQDVLANALNEHLDDLYRAARVPYLQTTADSAGTQGDLDPVDVLDELLRPSRREDETDDGGA